MCVVSMVADHYRDRFRDEGWDKYIDLYRVPTQLPALPPPGYLPVPPGFVPISEVSRAEFDELKKLVMEMRDLLKRAKEYDERNNEPHCETEEKVALIKKIADAVGVDLSEVFGTPAAKEA
jgi:hypothetical protein